MEVNTSKVAIVGAGSVGSTLAFNLCLKGAVTEIALIDSNREKAEAEILDIKQGSPLGRSLKIEAADYESCKDSRIVIITAGARQKPGETRVDLMERNVGIMKSIVKSWVAFAESGFPASRVMGSGTILDSARLREYVARHCRVNPQNIHGYVLGEHGDTSFPAWSLLTIGGIHLNEFCPVCGTCDGLDTFKQNTIDEVRQTAYRIIEAKGSTCYAIAQAGSVLVESIVRDERRILPISTVRRNFRGVEKTAFSFPAIVGKEGIARVLDFPLPPDEDKCLLDSAQFVSQNIAKAGY